MADAEDVFIKALDVLEKTCTAGLAALVRAAEIDAEQAEKRSKTRPAQPDPATPRHDPPPEHPCNVPELLQRIAEHNVAPASPGPTGEREEIERLRGDNATYHSAVGMLQAEVEQLRATLIELRTRVQTGRRQAYNAVSSGSDPTPWMLAVDGRDVEATVALIDVALSSSTPAKDPDAQP